MKKKLIHWFLSGCWVGFFPKAPGTFGTLLWVVWLAGLQDFFVPNLTSFLLFVSCIVIISSLATWCITTFLPASHYDQQWIVIDEIVGVGVAWLCFFWIPISFFWLVCLGILFRFFDIFKPAWIAIIDGWHTPFSVLLDDIVAGVYTGLGMTALYFLF